MLISDKILISSSKLSPCLLCSKNGRQFKTMLAKKSNPSENSKTEDPTFTLRVPKALLARSAVAVSGLGFLDAGYSGDWSRIGVISKETEDVLKMAAYLVAPLCLLLIFSISEEEMDL